MIVGHPQICLFQPEIPQNTGNIGRLAAATGSRLNLVLPLGFSTDDKNLRRPGLDYWPYLDLEIHQELDFLLNRHISKVAFLTKHGTKPYTEIPTDTTLLVFGRETSGLPKSIHEKHADYLFTIPQFHDSVRSLNLANAVSIVLYDQLAKRGRFSTDSNQHAT